jgi:GNAT superfamily N-acetyltransferase
MRRIQTGREQFEALNPLPWKIAGKVPQGYQVVPSENGKAWNAYHDSGTYVGGIFVATDKHTGQRYVSDIKIKPDHRRQGIASALWEAAGRPLHTPLEQTPEGAAWAKSVGGEDIQGDDYEPQKRQANSRTAAHFMWDGRPEFINPTDLEMHPDELAQYFQ